MLPKFASFVTAAMFLLCVCIPTSAQTTNGWTKAAPLPQGGVQEVYGASVDDKLYVLGGIDFHNGSPLGLVLEYDSTADRWSEKKKMARPAHHTAQAVLGGKIYVFGGFAASNTERPGWLPINNAWEYDPKSDSWKALAPMPTARGSAGAVSFGSKIYVIGGAGMHPGIAPAPLGFGKSAHQALNTVEEYDPKSNTWRSRVAMPTPRNHLAGIGAVNGKIYVIGGRVGAVFGGESDPLDLVEVYDPAIDQWGINGSRMPTPRSGGCYGVYNGKIYAGGGELRDTRLYGAYKVFEVYDPASDVWSTLPSSPVQRHGCTGAFIGNKLHFVGGDLQASDLYGFTVAPAQHDVYEVKEAR